MAAGRKITQRQKKQEPVRNSPLAKEISFVVILLFCILVLLSYFGLCGLLGNMITQLMFGLFGFLAYVFPVLLLFGGIIFLSNSENTKIKRKVYYGGVLYLLLTALLQWFAEEDVSSVVEYFVISSENHTGGGLIGGTLSHLLQIVLGRVGSLLVIIAGMLILFILLTGKMLFTTIREIFTGDGDGDFEEETESGIPDREPNRTGKKSGRKMADYKFDKEKHTEESEKRKPKRSRKQEKEAENNKLSVEKEQSPEQPEINIFRSDGQASLPKYEKELTDKFGRKESKTKDSTPVEAPAVNLISDLDSEKDIPDTAGKSDLQKELEQAASAKQKKIIYKLPSLDLLNSPSRSKKGMTNKELTDTAMKLKNTLESFGVRVKMGDISCGPSVTRYELSPEQGVKVSRITGLADDIKLSLAAADIRIEAPVPGKAAVGIEVPNSEKVMVTFRELLETQEFSKAKSKVSFSVGKDISGKTIVTDVAKMPHLLVAGATGSGKSVCINTLIMSILYKATPDEVKLILIDPKMVEFGIYKDIPHLMIPVVTDPKKAAGALNWAVAEMTNRYNKFAELSVRNIEGYNKRITKMTNKDKETYQPMPQVVIIVDEFADLMMVAKGEVEEAVCRLAQLARAAGIHLVLATQRPSVNVITGLIKANIPSRIALSVSSAIDSRTIIDGSGAEKLLGNGDMLFAPGDFPKPVRIQGAFVSEQEVGTVVDFIKGQFDAPPDYDENITAQINTAEKAGNNSMVNGADSADGRDELFIQAAQFIIEKDKASIGMLQRVFRIGFNRAARIMDQLCEAGVVGAEEGTKPRMILMSAEQFENYLEENG